MDKTTIGKFIATLRKSAGMTQKQLAEILNVSDKTISHWERDESSPDLSMIPIIAEVFGITCDELLKGEKQEPKVKETQSDMLDHIANKYEKKVKNLFENGFTIHKILCTVAAGLTALALMKTEMYAFQLNAISGFSSDMFGSFGFAFFFSVCIYYIVSAVLLCVSHARIKNKINTDDVDSEKKRNNILQANRITAYSGLFTSSVAITTLFQLITLNSDIYPLCLLIFIPVEFVVVIITIALLKNFNRLPNKKQDTQSKKDFKFRLRAIFFALVFVVCGISAQIVIGYFDGRYGHAEMFFDEDEFIEYMETYKPFPSEFEGKLEPIDAYLYENTKINEKGEEPIYRIDAISSDGYYIEMTEFGRKYYNPFPSDYKDKLSPVDSYLHEHPEINEKDYEPIYRIYGTNFYDGSEKTFDFKWCNHEVKYFEANEDIENIIAYTYEVDHHRDILNKVTDFTYHFAFVYYPVVTLICIIICIAVPIHRRKKQDIA